MAVLLIIMPNAVLMLWKKLEELCVFLLAFHRMYSIIHATKLFVDCGNIHSRTKQYPRICISGITCGYVGRQQTEWVGDVFNHDDIPES